jgi:poly(A) polymerase
MTAVGAPERLEPQAWMSAPETRAVIAALTAAGAEVRFVGGCVRDALAGRPVKDVDLATPDRPEKVIELLRAAGLKAIPTGLDHGTVTAVAGHHPFEITTLRRADLQDS